jgi:hypothetical protein
MIRPVTCQVALAPFLALLSAPPSPPPPPPQPTAPPAALTLPGSPFGIAAGFLYGYEGTRAYQFMPQVRALHAGFTKVYLFWNQVEPERGRYDWTAVDRFVAQLRTPEEGLIALFSASQWATRTVARQLPPSPAKDPDDYYRFVCQLVRHCKGRVRYWQNDAEPNNPLFWSGSKEEFVAQLKVFYRAVKSADPSAMVVVGGYDGMFGPPGTHQFPQQQAGLAFFDHVLDQGRDAFDLFDLRLYGDPYTIVARVQFMREKMRTRGYEKPIVCLEYGGPSLFEFAENRKYIPLVLAWSQAATSPENHGQPAPGRGVRDQIRKLYEIMPTLPPQTQMFMQGCPPELDARYQRIQARSLVMRNLFALSAGVEKTVYWYLPDSSFAGEARYELMTLMYGKVGLIEVVDDVRFGRRLLGAEVFSRMARTLSGVRQVRAVDSPGHPTIFHFQIDRAARGPLHVIWEKRDSFSGEDAPPVVHDCPWAARAARAVDAFGRSVPLQVSGGRLRLPVSITPIFVEPLRRPAD